jgi:hypothetical protein
MRRCANESDIIHLVNVRKYLLVVATLVLRIIIENGISISFQDIFIINPTYFDIVFHIVQM